MNLTLTQLIALATQLAKIYAEYEKLGGHATPAQILPLVAQAIRMLTDAGLTLQDLATILQEIGPLLPLILKAAK